MLEDFQWVLAQLTGYTLEGIFIRGEIFHGLFMSAFGYLFSFWWGEWLAKSGATKITPMKAWKIAILCAFVAYIFALGFQLYSIFFPNFEGATRNPFLLVDVFIGVMLASPIFCRIGVAFGFRVGLNFIGKIEKPYPTHGQSGHGGTAFSPDTNEEMRFDRGILVDFIGLTFTMGVLLAGHVHFSPSLGGLIGALTTLIAALIAGQMYGRRTGLPVTSCFAWKVAAILSLGSGLSIGIE